MASTGDYGGQCVIYVNNFSSNDSRRGVEF